MLFYLFYQVKSQKQHDHSSETENLKWNMLLDYVHSLDNVDGNHLTKLNPKRTLEFMEIGSAMIDIFRKMEQLDIVQKRFRARDYENADKLEDDIDVIELERWINEELKIEKQIEMLEDESSDDDLGSDELFAVPLTEDELEDLDMETFSKPKVFR